MNKSMVSACLPLINTLKELVATGDKVIKIKGFSGTMSYIFNELSTGKPDGPTFSSVVKATWEKGYTEPYPADDLKGFNVARKLTILSWTISIYSIQPTVFPELSRHLRLFLRLWCLQAEKRKSGPHKPTTNGTAACESVTDRNGYEYEVSPSHNADVKPIERVLKGANIT
ncbi:hypothetical protein JOM56_015053 [Amanita muscaria]